MVTETSDNNEPVKELTLAEKQAALGESSFYLPSVETLQTAEEEGDSWNINLLDGREIEFSIYEEEGKEDCVVIRVIGAVKSQNTLEVTRLALSTKDGLVKGFADVKVGDVTFRSVKIIASKQAAGTYFVRPQSRKDVKTGRWYSHDTWSSELEKQIAEIVIPAYVEKAKNAPVLEKKAPQEPVSEKKLDDLELMDKAQKVAIALYSDVKEFEGHKFEYFIGGKVRKVDLGGYTFLTQNPDKVKSGTNTLSEPAKQAREGHKIVWVADQNIRGKYIAKVTDGKCEFLLQK